MYSKFVKLVYHTVDDGNFTVENVVNVMYLPS